MLPVVPTRRVTALFVLAAAVMLVALVAGVPARMVTWATTATLVGLAGALGLDFLLTRRAWHSSPPQSAFGATSSCTSKPPIADGSWC